MSITTITTNTIMETLSGSEVPTQGTLRYIARGTIPTPSPHLYHLPPLSEFSDVRSLPLHDIKSSLDQGHESPYRLDTHGFTARRHPSVLHSAPYCRSSWNDENLIKEIYIPEVEGLVKHLTGAKTVATEAALMRNCTHTEVDGLATSEDNNNKKPEKSSPQNEATPEDDFSDDPFPKMIGLQPTSGASPAPKIHLDFSPQGARTHLRLYHPHLNRAGTRVIEAENSLLSQGIPAGELKDHYNGPRWSMFSIWRPLKTVKRDPLALSDVRYFAPEDYVPVEIVEPTGRIVSSAAGAPSPPAETTHKAGSYLSHHSPHHKWHWISSQQPEEVLIIKLFDSEAEKRHPESGGGVMHSSVEIEGTEGEEARESLEVRCTAFW